MEKSWISEKFIEKILFIVEIKSNLFTSAFIFSTISQIFKTKFYILYYYVLWRVIIQQKLHVTDDWNSRIFCSNNGLKLPTWFDLEFWVSYGLRIFRVNDDQDLSYSAGLSSKRRLLKQGLRKDPLVLKK